MGYFFGLFYKIGVKRGENGREAGEKVVVVPIWRCFPKWKNPVKKNGKKKKHPVGNVP
jgi:hypothetical protein